MNNGARRLYSVVSIFIVTFLFVLITQTALSAQEAVEFETADMAKMQKAMELAQPGPEHANLAAMAGDWKAHVKIWEQPGKPPMESEGTSKAHMILDGRFLMVEGHTQLMGMPFEYLTIIGFDRRDGEYTATGYDVMGTYSIFAKGKMEEDGKTIRMYGEDYDPTFGFTQKYDLVYRKISDDQYEYAVIFKNPEMTFGEKEFKMVEATYTRVKAEK